MRIFCEFNFRTRPRLRKHFKTKNFPIYDTLRKETNSLPVLYLSQFIRLFISTPKYLDKSRMYLIFSFGIALAYFVNKLICSSLSLGNRDVEVLLISEAMLEPIEQKESEGRILEMS